MSSLQAVSILETPIGRIAIGATDSGVSDLEILVSGKSRSEFAETASAKAHATKAAGQLREYFDGSRTKFELDLDLVGTKFQKLVWAQIATIGFGEDKNYGEIARNLENPKASRAVGAAVGANPIPIIIGCHRVLGSDRRLTGYSGGEGLKTKLWLLEHERIDYR